MKRSTRRKTRRSVNGSVQVHLLKRTREFVHELCMPEVPADGDVIEFGTKQAWRVVAEPARWKYLATRGVWVVQLVVESARRL